MVQGPRTLSLEGPAQYFKYLEFLNFQFVLWEASSTGPGRLYHWLEGCFHLSSCFFLPVHAFDWVLCCLLPRHNQDDLSTWDPLGRWEGLMHFSGSIHKRPGQMSGSATALLVTPALRLHTKDNRQQTQTEGETTRERKRPFSEGCFFEQGALPAQSCLHFAKFAA